MRSLQVTALEGPTSVKVEDVETPTGLEGLIGIEVKAVGLSWPDLLQSRGEYQVKPEVPFQLGVDFSGVVTHAGGGFDVGDRVACVLPYGGGAEQVFAHPEGVFALPEALSFIQGAAVPMNYLTAHFALTTRAGLNPGETVLVHGASGGLGTASIQVAKGLGARVIAVTSTQQKAEYARQAGADEAVLTEGFREAVKALTDGVGVDVIVDVVGGDLMTDSLRSLAPLGRLLVLGFTGGSIPEVKVNRLLLNNVDVRGVGWGAFAMMRSGYMRQQWDDLVALIDSGAIDPPISAVRPVEEVAEALAELEQRTSLGKIVLTF